MESRFRYRFFSPTKILQGADIQPQQTVLEVGCGTGFFTITAAQLIGNQGCLVAMDVLPVSIEQVSKKIQNANLENIRLVQGDALDTGMVAGIIDKVLLFGVIPSPVLPLIRLLPEMHRVLKQEGTLAVWPPVPDYLPQSILKSELFMYISRWYGGYNFKRV